MCEVRGKMYEVRGKMYEVRNYTSDIRDNLVGQQVSPIVGDLEGLKGIF
ncbi:MAG: hypothetical protein JWN83_1181 [Chitinophagaceae bacterium]|nr:hypothetical protein [Chitinophagaceae bacterium]